MSEQEIREWLSDWVDDNIQEIGFVEDKSNFKNWAEMCRIAAEAEGISREALDDAADGDLERLMQSRQNSNTDRIVAQKAARD